MSLALLNVEVRAEHDVVTARQRARQVAALVGFGERDQTRIATAVSELARNAYNYANGGRINFALEGRTAPQVLVVQVSDHGPGIAALEDVLAGRYRSATGMGLGILGARRMSDQFHIDSRPGEGTTITLRKILPPGAPLLRPQDLPALADQLHQQRPRGPLDELQRQNQELLGTLEELHQRQEQLLHLNHELEDTNRGVLALYAELDEKADHLRRADELKTRFLSNMSHEFRTPLNSIMALSGLLLEPGDGQLSAEQRKQVQFVRKACEGLTELVDDLLDLAKVEAGKIVVRPVEFAVSDLLGALRGMLRPLLINESLALIFEDVPDLPSLYSDEGKVSQILRNFVSNALKFTERGEVRVTAQFDANAEQFLFTVADTGIGIAAEDHERIFQEFGQLENPIQRRVRGTGLGLPLSRKLARLLGGEVWVESQVGQGSRFHLRLPRVYAEGAAAAEPPSDLSGLDPTRPALLIVEDAPGDRLLYEKFLRDREFQCIHAGTLRQAREVLAMLKPRAVILDIVLRGEHSWGFLADLKTKPATRHLPVIVISAVDDPQKAASLGADAFCVKPVQRAWLLGQLDRLAARPAPLALVVDDDAVARYLLSNLLRELGYTCIEAGGGEEGLHLIRQQNPAVLFLDLTMPEVSGFQLLDRLQPDISLRHLPVVVYTSRQLTSDEMRVLKSRVLGVMSKAAPRDAALVELRHLLGFAGLLPAPVQSVGAEAAPERETP